MKKIIFLLPVFFVIILAAEAQESKVNWKRSEAPVSGDIHLFHANQTINLPTAETLRHGNFEFEISHRFFPPVSEGSDALFGFDGPVNMRLGLAYGVTDHLLVALGRSNVNDNIDLQVKYKAFQRDDATFPIVIAVQGGLAWNTQTFLGRKDTDSRNFQYYARLIINTMYKEKLGIGIVPTYIYNSDISTEDAENSVTLGSYVQYYLNRAFSLMAEWNPNISGYHREFNSGSFGIEIETGGHFFKIIMTNSMYLNPSQFTAGSEYSFDTDEWRFGFNITRLLKFW